MSISLSLFSSADVQVEASFDVRVSSWGDEIKQSMNPVVAEAGVALNARLLGKDIVVLSLEIGHDFLEAVIVE